MTSHYAKPSSSEAQSHREQIKTHNAYSNFINSLSSPSTRHSYSMYLFRFLALPQYADKTLSQILQMNPKILEADIIENIISMREKEGLSSSSTSLFLAYLHHFFSINDVILNRKKINKFIGEHQSKHEYRSYTVDEISRLLYLQEERGAAIVLLMASTGMRVGALPRLMLKHLKKRTINETAETYVYQITVYANSPKSRYITFCTPECAMAIDSYLEMRQRHGESSLKRDKNGNWVPDDTPLIRRQFDKTKPHFIYSMESPITRQKYQKRLEKSFDFLKLHGNTI